MFNYDNIGGKIKSLARAAFIVEAIAAVISGLVMISEDDDMIPIALLVIIAGPIIAWVGSWLLYGFGQLIDNSDTLVKNSASVADFTKATADFSQDNARNSYLIVEELKQANQPKV